VRVADSCQNFQFPESRKFLRMSVTGDAEEWAFVTGRRIIGSLVH
jgi:hypothetical protein